MRRSRRAAAVLVLLAGVVGSAGCHEDRTSAGTDNVEAPDGGLPGSPCVDDTGCGNPYLLCAGSVCAVRYLSLCSSNSDCGPAGFTCNQFSCVALPTTSPCASNGDCPQGWSCYAPCPCRNTDNAKGCYPPFLQFNCPVCINADG